MKQAQTGYLTSILLGGAATLLMLAFYFVAVGLISGLNFALEQFEKFRYFIVALALGFGIQAGLYGQLRILAGRHGASGKVMLASGATSAVSMASCCAHYLVNVLPIMGVTGFLTVVAEYQIEVFWLGLAFNAAGIFYIASKTIKATKEHEKC